MSPSNIEQRSLAWVTKKTLRLSTCICEQQSGSGIGLKQALHKSQTARNKQSNSTYLVGLCSHNPLVCSPCRRPSELDPDDPTPPRLERQPHPCHSPNPETTGDLSSAPVAPGYPYH